MLAASLALLSSCSDTQPGGQEQELPVESMAQVQQAEPAICSDVVECPELPCTTWECILPDPNCTSDCFGLCLYTPTVGATCDDENDCTGNGKCAVVNNAAACVGAPPIPEMEGEACDDRNVCTLFTACKAGTCVCPTEGFGACHAPSVACWLDKEVCWAECGCCPSGEFCLSGHCVGPGL